MLFTGVYISFITTMLDHCSISHKGTSMLLRLSLLFIYLLEYLIRRGCSPMVPVVHSDRFAERSGQFTHAGRTDRRPHSRGQIRERWVCDSLDFHE